MGLLEPYWMHRKHDYQRSCQKVNMVNVCPLKNSAYFGDEDGIDLNPGTFIQSQNLMGDGQMSWHHWELSHLQAQCPSILPLSLPFCWPKSFPQITFLVSPQLGSLCCHILSIVVIQYLACNRDSFPSPEGREVHIRQKLLGFRYHKTYGPPRHSLTNKKECTITG